MEGSKFKVGDRVVTTCGVFAVEKGMVGTVVDFNWCGGHVLVKFDGWHNGHDGRGTTASGKLYEGKSCLYVNERHLKKVANETIVLYREDNRVIAIDKSTGEIAEAICSPEDTFDFHTGAKLAFDRLMGEKSGAAAASAPEPVKYNGKIIFTKGDDTVFETGHIYEVKDGKMNLPYGIKFPYHDVCFESIAHMKECFGRGGLELIEVLED